MMTKSEPVYDLNQNSSVQKTKRTSNTLDIFLLPNLTNILSSFFLSRMWLFLAFTLSRQLLNLCTICLDKDVTAALGEFASELPKKSRSFNDSLRWKVCSAEKVTLYPATSLIYFAIYCIHDFKAICIYFQLCSFSVLLYWLLPRHTFAR